MTPYLTGALADQRIADLRRDAEASRLAAGARAARRTTADGRSARRAGGLIRLLGRRRYRQIELVWPDGVCSVVPARSDDPKRPLADSRR